MTYKALNVLQYTGLHRLQQRVHVRLGTRARMTRVNFHNLYHVYRRTGYPDYFFGSENHVGTIDTLKLPLKLEHISGVTEMIAANILGTEEYVITNKTSMSQSFARFILMLTINMHTCSPELWYYLTDKDHWRIKGESPGTPPGPNSFFFMQFSAKNQNNRGLFY